MSFIRRPALTEAMESLLWAIIISVAVLSWVLKIPFWLPPIEPELEYWFFILLIQVFFLGVSILSWGRPSDARVLRVMLLIFICLVTIAPLLAVFSMAWLMHDIRG